MHVVLRRLLLLGLVIALAACQQQTPPTAEPLPNELTAFALTPTATATPEPTATSEATNTPEATATAAATARPTVTGTPATTPSAATPTPGPSGTNASYCTTSFGPQTVERFSARLDAISITSDQVSLDFAANSSPPAGVVACLAPSAAQLINPSATISAVLRIELPQWSHDDAWSSSLVTLSLPLLPPANGPIVAAVLQPQTDRSAGLVLEVGLDQALPFSVSVDGSKVSIQVASSPQLGDDPLGQDKGQPAAPSKPLIFSQSGDLWRLEGERVLALSTTLAIEHDPALSPDGSKVAFCRTAPDSLPALGALWVSDSDGNNEQLIADVGGCAQPAWSFDGASVWFTAPWSAIQPLNFRLWQAYLDGSEPTPRSELDAWSRLHPQPLPRGGVVALGINTQGTGTVLLTDESGNTHDIGTSVLATYTSIAEVLAAPDGRTLAVVAQRSDGGADLLQIDQKGKITDRSATTNWWNRPLAWSASGTLFYLETRCNSSLVWSYALHMIDSGSDTIVAEGTTLAALGPALVIDEGLVYVREVSGQSALRGPAPAITGPSSIWLLDPQTGDRAELLRTPAAISALQ